MDAKTLTWGVEIECYIPDNEANSTRFYSEGYHAMRPVRGSNRPENGWRIETDGSLMPPSAHFGREFVSPTMAGTDGLRRVSELVAMLEGVGAITNERCGLHVNVGIPTRMFTMGEVHAVRRWYCRLEEGLYSIMGLRAEARKGTTYARPFNSWSASNWQGEKYQSVNFRNARNADAAKARVEYRLFEGRVDLDYVMNAIFLAVGFTAFALTTQVVPHTVPMDADRAVTVIRKSILGHYDSSRHLYPYSISVRKRLESVAGSLTKANSERLAVAIPR